jgi:hypothetical protein
MKDLSDIFLYGILHHILLPFFWAGVAFFCTYGALTLWARRYRTIEWLATANLRIMLFWGGIFLLFCILSDFSPHFGVTTPYMFSIFSIQIGGFAGCFFAHALFKSWRKTLMIIAAPFLVVLLPYLFLKYIYDLPNEYSLWPRVEHCDFYTKKLKGGMHRFAGQDYRITLCGARSKSNKEDIS